MDYRYCPLCRAELTSAVRGGETRLVCPQCAFVHWRNPVPVVAAVVERAGHASEPRVAHGDVDRDVGVAHAQARVGSLLDQIDAQLSGHGKSWFLGEDFGLADVYGF